MALLKIYFLVGLYVNHKDVAFLKNITEKNITTICFYKNIMLEKLGRCVKILLCNIQKAFTKSESIKSDKNIAYEKLDVASIVDNRY